MCRSISLLPSAGVGVIKRRTPVIMVHNAPPVPNLATASHGLLIPGRVIIFILGGARFTTLTCCRTSVAHSDITPARDPNTIRTCETKVFAIGIWLRP